jgi:hypothetical protein
MMTKHFYILALASILFFIASVACTHDIERGREIEPGAAADANSVKLMYWIRIFSLYAATVVLIIAHGLLTKKGTIRTSSVIRRPIPG